MCVCVTEMTGPIQEMTRNSQQREPLPFTPVSCHEKVKTPNHHRPCDSCRWRRCCVTCDSSVLLQMGEVLYEERVYHAGHWASVTSREDLYEQSISMAFMKLMRFICKENSAG